MIPTSVVVLSMSLLNQASIENINYLIKTIDDNPDLLHSDYTPSVYALINLGMPALPPLLDVMVTSNSRATRDRAERAISGITKKEFGFVRSTGWTVSDGEKKWEALWIQLGSLSADDNYDDRAASVDKWKKWIRDKK